MVKPKAKREAVEFVKEAFGLSNRQSCSLIGLWRSTQRYTVKDPNRDDAIKTRMKELAKEYPRSGCPMIHDVLKREGLVVNIKRTERIYYREEKLSLRRRPCRRKACHNRLELPETSRPNERLAMDFVHDSLWNGRKLKALNIVDVFTKEAIKIEVDTSISGEHVVQVLDQVAEDRGFPGKVGVVGR